MRYNRWAVIRKTFPGHKGRPGQQGGSLPREGARGVPPAKGEEGPGHSMGERPPLSSFEKPVPEGQWSAWTVKNYRRKFREHTGNYLDDSISLEHAQDIAARLEDWPKTGRPATFATAEERIMVSTMFQKGEAGALYDKHTQTITFSPRFKHLGTHIVQHEYGHHLDRGTKTIETSLGKTKILPMLRSATRSDPVGKLVRQAHVKNRYPNYRGSSVELLPKAMMDLDKYAEYGKKGGHMAAAFNPGSWKKKYPELYEAIEITVGGKENMPERWRA